MYVCQYSVYMCVLRMRTAQDRYVILLSCEHVKNILVSFTFFTGNLYYLEFRKRVWYIGIGYISSRQEPEISLLRLLPLRYLAFSSQPGLKETYLKSVEFSIYVFDFSNSDYSA